MKTIFLSAANKNKIEYKKSTTENNLGQCASIMEG